MKQKKSVEVSITDVRGGFENFVNAKVSEETYPKLYWKLKGSDGDQCRDELRKDIAHAVARKLYLTNRFFVE